MDTDKAYLLGLMIGGGVFGNAEDVFTIHLPFKKWGSYTENKDRAQEIISDILKKISPIFRAVYGLTVQYETMPGGDWTILCEGDYTAIKEELENYGIDCCGELRGNADISKIVEDLVDDNLKRRFIAGIVDTIGSMAKSHRRFSDEHQTVSLEIKGYNFKLICGLCNLLYSVGCIPDQVMWNHPNIHCTSNPYYEQWNKGFKIRILLDQYANFGSFAFRTKAKALKENRSLQKETHKAKDCAERKIRISPSSVHPAENDALLPETIRGGHYLNSKHFCAVLGCDHAPYSQICACFSHIGDYVIPFPILSKGTKKTIEDIVKTDKLMSSRQYAVISVKLSTLLSQYHDNKNLLMYGTNDLCGYPIRKILQAVAFVIADDSELNGKRIDGHYVSLLKKYVDANADICVEFHKPDLLTPLIAYGNGKGALIGAVNPKVYGNLITYDSNNKYKILVREITEEDLNGAEQEE